MPRLPQIALAPAFVDERMQLRVRVQVVDALDVADQHIPFGGVERVGARACGGVDLCGWSTKPELAVPA